MAAAWRPAVDQYGDREGSSSTLGPLAGELAAAFAMVGYPITPGSLQRTSAMDFRDLTPGDFAYASTFEVVRPMDESH